MSSSDNKNEDAIHPQPVRESTTKKILSCGRSLPSDFVKGAKATFHFKVSYRDPSEGCEVVIDDSHHPLGGKEERPMELLVGKQFKMPVLEEMIKTMRVGEVARFTAIAPLCINYPFVSKQYRAYVKSFHKKGNEEEHRPSGHCCGVSLQQGTGYSDLDKLVTFLDPKEGPTRELEFIIDLLSVEKPDEYEQEIWQMTDEEKIEKIPILKEEGNRFYKEGMPKMDSNKEESNDKALIKIRAAFDSYAKGLTMIEQLQLKEKPGETEWKAWEIQKLPFLSNMAQCKLVEGDYYRVIQLSSQVLDIDEGNVKALFRRGKANGEVWNVKEAISDLNRVKELDSTMDVVVMKELTKIEQRAKKKAEEEKKRFAGKLFS